jgi:chorismate mutase
VDRTQTGRVELTTVIPALNSIDATILLLAKDRWQKVAMIVAKAEQKLGEMTKDKLDLVVSRVRALVEEGRLEAQGDLHRPRHSEVRLTPRRESSPRIRS